MWRLRQSGRRSRPMAVLAATALVAVTGDPARAATSITANSTPIVLATCTGGNDQKWSRS